MKKDLFRQRESNEEPRAVCELQHVFSYKAGDIFSYFEQEKRKIYRKAQAELAKPASSIGKHLTFEDFSRGVHLGKQASIAQAREDPRRSRSRQAAATGLLLLKRDRSLANLDSRGTGGQLTELISKIDRRSPRPRKPPQLLERDRKLLSHLHPARLSTPSHLSSAQQIRRKFFY